MTTTYDAILEIGIILLVLGPVILARITGGTIGFVIILLYILVIVIIILAGRRRHKRHIKYYSEYYTKTKPEKHYDVWDVRQKYKTGNSETTISTAEENSKYDYLNREWKNCPYCGIKIPATVKKCYYCQNKGKK